MEIKMYDNSKNKDKHKDKLKCWSEITTYE